MKFKKIFNFHRKEHYCYFCGENIHTFLPYKNGELSRSLFICELDMIGSDVENFSCPVCHCHDRERHLLMYFDALRIWDLLEDTRVLHIASENVISKKMSKINIKEYIRGDLYPVSDDIEKIDISLMKYVDDYFDFIICNHVLEHVEDDIKSMTELYRVLKKNGHAVLQTPYSNLLSKTFVDENINTDELRLKYYGQEDHVRVFGHDFFSKLESVGFKLKIKQHSDILSNLNAIYYGVNEREPLILVEK